MLGVVINKMTNMQTICAALMNVQKMNKADFRAL